MEFAAVLFTVICIFLAGRNNVHTWWTGIVACILYGFVFYEAKLYADTVLQVFFVATGIMGWSLWYQRQGKPELPITSVSTDSLVGIIGVGGLVLAGYTYMLSTYTDAYAPGWDSGILIASVIGQILMMRRKVENWYFWVIVNTIAVPLFWSRELYLSSVLYAAFWVHAWYALYRWTNIMRTQKA